MNESLTTHQHEKQISYWVTEKKVNEMNWLSNKKLKSIKKHSERAVQ